MVTFFSHAERIWHFGINLSMSNLWEYWNSIDNNDKNHPLQERRRPLPHPWENDRKSCVLENMKSQPKQDISVCNNTVFIPTIAVMAGEEVLIHFLSWTRLSSWWKSPGVQPGLSGAAIRQHMRRIIKYYNTQVYQIKNWKGLHGAGSTKLRVRNCV